MMEALPSQEFLESLIVRKKGDIAPYKVVIIYFSAKWCGPCKRLDINSFVRIRPDIAWFKCDVDALQYTATYCNVSSIPAFMAIVNGKPLPLHGADETLAAWIAGLGH